MQTRKVCSGDCKYSIFFYSISKQCDPTCSLVDNRKVKWERRAEVELRKLIKEGT